MTGKGGILAGETLISTDSEMFKALSGRAFERLELERGTPSKMLDWVQIQS